MQISNEQLRYIYPDCPSATLDKYVPLLNVTMDRFEINTPVRIRMFLAQVGHESGQLRYTEELASGQAYEGRVSLGDTEPGDGVRYKGRGLIQITGRNNYALCGLSLDLPLLDNPELLAQPDAAALSAGWYWQNNNLNSLCDLNLFQELTKRINGGLNGYPNRYQLYQRALQVIPG